MVRSTETTGSRDERLAHLLAELGEAVRRGETPDVEAVAAGHPDLAGELRELWATALFAEEFTQRTFPYPPPQPLLPVPTANLPRSFGDYELLEELGRGGMGVVYKAYQKSLQRTVALKMILRGDLATATDRSRFQTEARAAGKLSHPHIVPVYDAGEADGHAFTMRFVEGKTLAKLLAERPLRPRDAVRLLVPICRAVQHAHEQGILHRDIKPSNVLLDTAGQPLVTDFGLAKHVGGGDGLTQSGAVLGTPAYMAPEQVSGSRGKPSPASDVYSLGVILYEMLTGRQPFQAATPVDTMLLVLDQDPVRPRLLNSRIDPDLELVCLKCLQKEPLLRYVGAGELAADLQAYLAGEELSVRSLGLRDVGAMLVNMLRETPNAVVLENWGLLWMCHSAMILLMCVLTTAMKWNGVTSPWGYLLLWGGGLIVWGSVFWRLRKRGGPVLFVERQVAHVWGAAVVGTIGVFLIEVLLGLPVLMLSPILAVLAGMVFAVKAGMLSGSFYLSSAAMFLTAIPMCLFPDYGPLMFGAVSAATFFIPGLKYNLRRRSQLRRREPQERAAATP